MDDHVAARAVTSHMKRRARSAAEYGMKTVKSRRRANDPYPQAPHESNDPEQELVVLNFAARLLLHELDRDVLIERALETLADFGRTDRTGLFLLNRSGDILTLQGSMDSNVYAPHSVKFSVAGTIFEDIIRIKTTSLHRLVYRNGTPWPTRESGEPHRRCLCAPLIAGNNLVIGVVAFDQADDAPLSGFQTQAMMTLLSIVAISLENARLFQMALTDGLTGLYVHRFFEVRLSEEESRVKRQGNWLSLIIADIDHFKSFNDRFGHQLGDVVLKETAQAIKNAVRKGVDVVCRYGGEEFAVILPDTSETVAHDVAERIRQACERHAVPGPSGPLTVTVSVGVAGMNRDGLVQGEELFRRADAALYQAKNSGRNRTVLWRG